MSESEWRLKGVDPVALERAAVEAAHRGLSLADYLTDVVLHAALGDQVGDGRASATVDHEAPLAGVANLATGPEIEALGRHLGTSVNTALHALDTCLSTLGHRIGALETCAEDTEQTVGGELQDLRNALSTLRLQLTGVENAARITHETNNVAYATLADACGELERRVEGADAVARGADQAARQLAKGQHSLRASIAEDLDRLSRETEQRVNAGLGQVRATADKAAAQTDAAVARLIEEMRALRRATDDRIAESAAETTNRMQSAFKEAAGLHAALSDRVGAGERQAEQFRVLIADTEDGAQTALEETALALRRADALLAADIVRVSEGGSVALEMLRADVAARAADLHERQIESAARITNIEGAIASASELIASRYEELERLLSGAGDALRNALDRAEAEAAEQVEAAMARAAELEKDIAHVRRTLGGEIERVEACTLAALEKQTEARAAGDAALTNAIGEQAAAAQAAVESIRAGVDDQIAALRGQQASALARLDCVDAALAGDSPLATVIAATADEVASLRTRVLGIQTAGREITERLSKLESVEAEAAKAFGALRMQLNDREAERQVGDRFGRLESAGAETASALADIRVRIDALAGQVAVEQTQRLGKLEASLADLRLGQVAGAANAEGLIALQGKMATLEQKSVEGFDKLHGEIGRFVEENERRLDALERYEAPDFATPLATIEKRVGELEQPDATLSAAIASLDGQIAAMEQRSAEALLKLHGDMAHFVAENERRLAELEHQEQPDLTSPFAAIERRLAELEQYDTGALFAELRARMEERILGVEQRNVRTLEQLSQTIALIEQRFAADDQQAATRSA